MTVESGQSECGIFHPEMGLLSEFIQPGKNASSTAASFHLQK